MTPLFRWKLEVQAPDETLLYEYGPEGVDGDGGIIGFPSFDIDSNGNCLTLQMTAIAQKCGIQPRDIITLYRYDDTIGDWAAWWKGVVTTAGTTNSEKPQEYQALGLKQLFYERVLLVNRWPAGNQDSVDAATLPSFDEAVNFTIPGVTTNGSSFPTLGFQVGAVVPGRQSFGEFLDARARQVGSFIVPAGETYSYDGVTYSEGDVVPEVAWGVDADGVFFFRRAAPDATPGIVYEDDPEADVEWSPYTSEGKSNYFTFVLIPDVDRERLLNASLTDRVVTTGPFFIVPLRSNQPTFVPLVALGPLTVPDPPVVEETIVVDNPLNFLRRVPVTVVANDLWSNLANAVDDNPATSALAGGTFTPITATGGTVTNVGDFRIHTFTSGGTFTVSDAGSNPEVEYLIVAGGGSGGASLGSGGSGGGAGGMLQGTTTVTATSYSITVGSGGAAVTTPLGNNADGVKGGNSSALGFTAEGGGRGRGNDGNGGSGGSGGGANAGGTLRLGGSGNVDEGNNGGNAQNTSAARAVAGGGGAGEPAPAVVGSFPLTNAVGGGGLGLGSTISGSLVTYARGGDGNATSATGTSGAANTGNGGSGASDSTSATSGAGGSGIVIIRYRVNVSFSRASGTAFDFSSAAVLETNPTAVPGDGGAFLVWYSADEPTAFAVRSVATLVTSTIDGTTTRTVTNEIQYEYPATNNDVSIRPRAILLPVLRQAAGTQIDAGDVTLYIQGANGLRIHDIGWYEPDDDVIQRVAEARVREPVTEAAVVDLQGYREVRREVEIVTVTSVSFPVPVERVEYSLTVDGGVATRYFAGQRFGPDAEAEAAVLNALIRRVSRVKEFQ